MTIEDEIETLKGFSKPLRNAGYDEIAKRVNEEIATLGDAGTFADLKLIDQRLGLPRGTSLRWADMLIGRHLRRQMRTDE
tara:strand:+ start:405 stop:644 length:240 start_codon:yes stop_codon:yes gene_type:complete